MALVVYDRDVHPEQVDTAPERRLLKHEGGDDGEDQRRHGDSRLV
jgi:hypothetical protein